MTSFRRILKKYSLVATHVLCGVMVLSFSILTETPWYLVVVNEVAAYFLVSFVFHKALWVHFCSITEHQHRNLRVN
jgi:hypothetical protein